MNTASFYQTLANVRHFAELPAAVQEALGLAAVLRRFPAGHIIYMEGEPAQAVYILAAGWVKSSRISPEGREQALLFLRPGEVFGDVAVLNGIPYPCTVTCLEAVEVWTIEKQRLIEMLSRYPELSLAVSRRLSERVLHYVGLVEDLTLRGVEARLAKTLLQNAEPDGGRLVVPRRAWTTFDEMATRLGTVRDVLARSLRSLEQEGLLRVEKQAIVILDPQGMVDRSNS